LHGSQLRTLLLSARGFLLFPLPGHLPKRNSVRQVDAALQTRALWIIALCLRRIAGAPLRKHRSAEFAAATIQLSQFAICASARPNHAGRRASRAISDRDHACNGAQADRTSSDQPASFDRHLSQPSMPSERLRQGATPHPRATDSSNSPIDGDLMIDGQDVLREICPSRRMFSRGKPRCRYRNLINGG
jgi:hypothetical protein